MEFGHGLLATDRQQFLDAVARFLLGLPKLARIGLRSRTGLLGSQIIPNGVGEHEITVGQALHQRAGAKAVRTVVGEIRFANDVQPRQLLIKL